MKHLVSFILLAIVFATPINGHPDGAIPYWYPSSFIYGYINGCADSVEQKQLPFTKEMWPDDVREVCACVVDSFRHVLTYQQITDNATNSVVVNIAKATFPVCVDETRARLGIK